MKTTSFEMAFIIRDFMPQLNKGGKFVFGISVIGNHNVIQIPEQALLEYGVEKEGRYR